MQPRRLLSSPLHAAPPTTKVPADSRSFVYRNKLSQRRHQQHRCHTTINYSRSNQRRRPTRLDCLGVGCKRARPVAAPTGAVSLYRGRIKLWRYCNKLVLSPATNASSLSLSLSLSFSVCRCVRLSVCRHAVLLRLPRVYATIVTTCDKLNTHRPHATIWCYCCLSHADQFKHALRIVDEYERKSVQHRTVPDSTRACRMRLRA